jgi:hypothetical protein
MQNQMAQSVHSAPGANEGFILFEEIFVELFPPMVERMRLLPQRGGSISPIRPTDI